MSIFVENNIQYVKTACVAEIIALLSVLAGPGWVKIIGQTVLLATMYATITVFFSCSDRPEYYTIKHVDDGTNTEQRLVRSFDPMVNALVWGPVAAWPVGALFGGFLSLCARYPIVSNNTNASSLLPVLMTMMVLVLPLGHIAAQFVQDEGNVERLPHNVLRIILFPRLENVREEFRTGWRMCNARSVVGYAAITFGGLAVGLSTLLLRVHSSFSGMKQRTE